MQRVVSAEDSINESLVKGKTNHGLVYKQGMLEECILSNIRMTV